ncbi:protein STAY-GREEN, chloroplastic-like [Hordeum vulgare subsp. vulgare]|uniref:protein STAY-GREEN, chloroplastic-like n=1 Tax=Hordeum vulgare subsp. vulgare TaxID=112509 RepID=UPI00029520DA|nr:protein STAY-GREEN, chloroplastic-like [Hordeum vulgare subsp. vulgare]
MAIAAAAGASTMSLLPISHLKQLQLQRRARPGRVLVLGRRRRNVVPRARLFGPAIFEASKLKVLFVGVDEEKHPGKLPRTYTLTHSDVTARLTLAVSHTIHAAQLQGWYNRLQRDEVVAEWKKVQGAMSLHVHCHISGGHFLLDLIAPLRYYIFRKELPVVLKAFVHGDGSLFSQHPELEEATVWVYFHSNNPNFNRVECWGPLSDAAAPYDDEAAVDSPAADAAMAATAVNTAADEQATRAGQWPRRCPGQCDCCFPPECLIPWPHEHEMAADAGQAPPQ